MLLKQYTTSSPIRSCRHCVFLEETYSCLSISSIFHLPSHLSYEIAYLLSSLFTGHLQLLHL